MFASTCLLLWLSKPLVISGDGVGYIKRLISPERDIIPGHLVYVPLLEWLRIVLVPDGGHAEAAVIATLFSALGGAAACALLCLFVYRVTDMLWAGLLAAGGMLVCYGFYRASGDVEAYSFAVALMTGTACLLVRRDDQPDAGWAVAAGAGVLLGVTTLLHTSLVLFTPFVLFASWRATGSWLKATSAILIGGALSLASFLGVAMGVLDYDLPGSLAWIMTSDNGYARPPDFSLSYFMRSLARLFYGVGRTLIHSPSPDRLGSEITVRLSSLGIGYFLATAAIVIIGLVRTSRGFRHPLWPLWIWVAPLTVFGFIFFPAATERWVMVLPCFWAAIAVALTALHRPKLIAIVAVALIAVPLLTNVLTVREERKLDARTLERSRAISQLLREGDLLLYPGHTWDEYVGFYETAPVERFILASFAGEEQGDAEALFDRLHRAIDTTHRRGGRVIAVRVFDAPDSHHGWNLLRAFGIPRDDVLAHLARYEAEPILDEPVAVWQVSAAPPRNADGEDRGREK